MKTLYVYADFNWMPEVELIGTLSYESLRGSDSYGFQFDNQWLSRYGALYLSDDLNNYPGMQYSGCPAKRRNR
jgi:serine/threonine-protein kinase HipA